jgi:DedD protein
MASSASSDAADLRRRGRQRLIGAVAIVLLLVVFIPMLLDSEPRRPREEPAMDIPNKDTVAPLPMPAGRPTPKEGAAKGLANADTATPADAGTATPRVAQPAVVTPSAQPPAKVEGAKAPSPPPSPKGEGAKAEGKPRLDGFAVQVGAFRDEAKLKQAREKLAAAGIPHYTERLDTSSGGLTRLRAGPFPTRQAADAASAKLKEGGLPSQVVPLP